MQVAKASSGRPGELQLGWIETWWAVWPLPPARTTRPGPNGCGALPGSPGATRRTPEPAACYDDWRPSQINRRTPHAQEIAWYENRLDEASADFGPQRVITAAADFAQSVLAADLDGDGAPDALSAS